MSVDPDCPSVDEVKSKKVILLWLLMHILMYMYMYSVYVCMLLISCGQCVICNDDNIYNVPCLTTYMYDKKWLN